MKLGGENKRRKVGESGEEKEKDEREREGDGASITSESLLVQSNDISK